MTAAHHDAPACPHCATTVVTPIDGPGHPREARRLDHLFCPACGEDWIETDKSTIVAAWFSWGAYLGHMADGWVRMECVRCGHAAADHAVDDEERRECVVGRRIAMPCACNQYEARV